LEAAVGAALIVGAAVPLEPLEGRIRRRLVLPFMALEAVVGAALIVGTAVPLDPLDIFKSRPCVAADTDVERAVTTIMARSAHTEKRVMLNVEQGVTKVVVLR
jgi:hypothetical protein